MQNDVFAQSGQVQSSSASRSQLPAAAWPAQGSVSVVPVVEPTELDELELTTVVVELEVLPPPPPVPFPVPPSQPMNAAPPTAAVSRTHSTILRMTNSFKK